MALLDALAGEHPDQLDDRRRLAVERNNLALALRRAGRTSQAAAEFQSAIHMQQALVAAHPDASQFRSDLAHSLNNLGQLQSETGATAEAEVSFGEAIRLYESVAGKPPGHEVRDPAALSDLAASYNNLAALLGETDAARAIELNRQAAEYQSQAVEARPDDLKFKSQWALTLNNLVRRKRAAPS